MNKTALAGFLALSACYDSHHGFEAEGIKIDVELKSQEQTSWCWAAVTQAFLSWQGVEHSQCEIVSKAFSRDCCSKPETCNNSFHLTQLEDAGLARNLYDGVISEDDLKIELSWNRPIVLYYGAKYGAHFVILTGYGEAAGLAANEFESQNSAYSQEYIKSVVTYQDLLDGAPSVLSGTGWHWQQTLTIQVQ